MGAQRTELLKGMLEGAVLENLAAQPCHGYELVTRLHRQGFSELAQSTVYSLLARAERRGLVSATHDSSITGPPRKVFALTAQGREHLREFWRMWTLISDVLEHLRQESE
ncbi:PadR family transcriptional regulator [Microbacterium sp. CH-015]|uniref:PadR family transcriptional regulator n=1 Tax=Microbacterium sp. CH-015 TaxID=3406734 RepID=UPI003C71CAF1